MGSTYCKTSREVFYAGLCGVVRRDRFWWRAAADFGTGSDVVTQALDWITMVGSGYVALLQMLIMPLIFVSIVGAFTKMKESEKSRRSVYGSCDFAGDNGDRCLDRNCDGHGLWS